MKPILEIREISKKYRIESNKQAYLSLRESLFSFLTPKNNKKEFWALKDISFDLMPGDTLGIIGKNGAGKSTLLKILSKITPPTSGNIIARGRIASLLEVGTGFHPELSGRENIYMNGSILGMRRKEIEKNFDAIVDFSGVEKFIDTPLKHYSSGMQLRLAFAVAAFLEPEILVIDEVLAVGDAEFQKKCLQKMEDVSQSGRSILFVSHQLSAIDSLCNRALILQQGRMVDQGTAVYCIEKYLSSSASESQQQQNQQSGLLLDLRATSLSGNHKIDPGETLVISGKFNIPDQIDNPTIGIVIRNIYNTPVLGINNRVYGKTLQGIHAGRSFEVVLPSLPLLPGTYDIDLYLGDGMTDHYTFENALSFEVNDRIIFENGKNPDIRLNTFILGQTSWTIK